VTVSTLPLSVTALLVAADVADMLLSGELL